MHNLVGNSRGQWRPGEASEGHRACGFLGVRGFLSFLNVLGLFRILRPMGFHAFLGLLGFLGSLGFFSFLGLRILHHHT